MNRCMSGISILRLMGIVLILLLGRQGLAVPPAPWLAGRRHEPVIDRVGNEHLRDSRVPLYRGGQRLLGTSVPTRGIVKLIAIRVQFPKDTDPGTSGTGQFPYTWGPTHDDANFLSKRLQSVTKYFTEVSGGAVTVNGTLSKIYTLPQTMAAYNADIQANGYAIATDAITISNPDIDFSQYDIVMIIHAGGDSANNPDANTKDIWSFEASGVQIQTSNGVIITSFALVPETECNDGILKLANPTLNIQQYETNATTTGVVIPQYWDALGTWVHELGHSFGLPDLYDTAYMTGLSLGDWSLMAAGNWLPGPADAKAWTQPNNPAQPMYGSVPCHIDAWCKALLGWRTLNNVTLPRIHEKISPQGTSTSGIYRMWTNGGASSEYFLLENRSKVGFDKYVPSQGLMIYHIDDSVGSFLLNNMQVDAQHPRIRPEPADGRIVVDPSFGNYLPSDNAAFPSVNDNTHFGTSTTPNSKTYLGQTTYVDASNIQQSGTDIYADLLVSQIGITITSPPTNSIIYVTRPTLYAVASGMDLSSLSIQVDGVTVGKPIINQLTGELTYALGPFTVPKVYQIGIVGNDATGQPYSIVTDVNIRKKTLPSGASLISLPVTGVGTVKSVLPNITLPAVASWNSALLDYQFYPDSFVELTTSAQTVTDMTTGMTQQPAGRGFWINLAQSTQLQLDGDNLRQDRQYKLPITYGFNLIGNPYIYPIGYGSILVEYSGQTYSMQDAVSARLIEPVIYWWNTTNYNFSALPDAVMQPWVGYWVLSHARTQITPMYLIFQPIPAGPIRSTGTAQSARAQGHFWDITINALRLQDTQQASVTVGALAGATGQTDFGMDVTAPPAAPNGITLTSRGTQPNENLLRDYRAFANGSTYRWTLSVKGTPGAQIAITWPQLTALPNNYLLTLHDQVTGDERYMRTTQNYTLTLGSQESARDLILTATPGTIGSLQIVNLQAECTRATGGSTISCQVTRAANVTVEVRTLTGRLIKRYPATTSTEGAMTITWNGTDTYGRRVPRGAYLCHVFAETSDGQKARAVTALPL